MKRFTLHGEMADLFCNQITLNASTMREAIEGLSTNFYGFRSYFLNKIVNGVNYCFVDVNGNEIESFCIDMPLTENEYDILPSVRGSSGNFGVGSALFGGNLALGFAMQWLSDKLNPVGEDGTEYEIITTNSHIYSKNENRAEQGTPIPVIYGQLRVGSKIISSSIHNYDYDYTEAQIYQGKPLTTNLSKLTNGSDFTFINPSDLEDLRMGSDNEKFNQYLDSSKDPTKRDFKIKNNVQQYHDSLGNEPVNSTFLDVQNGDSYNHLAQFGASEGVAQYSITNNAGWNDSRKSKSPRPFVYPIDSSVDKNMRPSSSSEYCVIRESKAGIETISENDRCLAFEDPNTPLIVGERGSYQKLESISIYKSLEVLSEGPIAGLANPITGEDRDNGFINSPFGKDESLIGSSNLKVGKLKFSNGSLISLENGDQNVLIKDGGSDYVDGTFLVAGDGTPVNGLSIKVDPPKNLSSASIGQGSFLDIDSNNDGLSNNAKKVGNETYYTSSNNLFVLQESNGQIAINNNSTFSQSPLNPEYIDNNNNINLKLLSDHSQDLPWRNSSFKIGQGYESISQDFAIHPENEDFEFTVDIVSSTETDRVSQAKCLDIATFFNKGTFFDEHQTNALNNFISSESNLIPFTSQSWDKLPRSFLDANQIDFNSSITFQIGAVFWRGQNIQDIQITITMKQYISLESVSVSNPHSLGVRSGNSANWEIWNNDSSSTQNLFDLLVRGSSIPLGFLLRNKEFADFVFGKFNELSGNNLESITLPSFSIIRNNISMDYGGGKYVKYTVGSGSTISNGTKFSNWDFSHHILDIANNNDFDNVMITDGGLIDSDDSPSPKGFYSPLIYPRVTVFTLRKTVTAFGNTSYNFLPTNIDSVAEVDRHGKVVQIHLLKVPDYCVYDNFFGFSPIQPHSTNYINPIALGESSLANKYQDIGFYCQIDPSNSSVGCNFIINNSQLSFDAVNGSTGHLCEIEQNWNSHIARHAGSVIGSGLVAYAPNYQFIYNSPNSITKLFDIEPNSNLNNPSIKARAKVDVENIDLSSGYKKTSLPNHAGFTANNFNFISTGRPSMVSLNEKGFGYTAKSGNSNGSKLNLSIFNQQKILELVNIENEGKGYKPSNTFYAFGYSRTKENEFNNLFLNSAKFKITTDEKGSIRSIDIIDPGFGFSEVLNENDLIFSNFHSLYNSLESTGLFGVINTTPNVIAENSLPKQSLVLSVDQANLETPGFYGSITKFRVSSVGLGFNKNQVLYNPFTVSDFVPPNFNVQISNGSVQSITLVAPSAEKGYSDADQKISIQVFASKNSSTTSTEGSPEDDDYAWARSIYLNDVPIRDKNGRFNYSKFHFDMRIGHGKNGSGALNLLSDQASQIQGSKQAPMISDEFKLPSFTKNIQFPMYGPRNENEKDYYYAHTIKNPEVSAITLSIQINKLHYIYEGDESTLFVNLIPVLAAGVAFMLGKTLAESIAAGLALPDKTEGTSNLLSKFGFLTANSAISSCPGMPVAGGHTQLTTGAGTTTGVVTVKAGEAKKAQMQTAAYAALVGGGAGAVAGAAIISIFGCDQIEWLCFKVGEIIKNSGEIWPAKMRVAVEYGIEGGEMKKDIIAFNGCATNPYVKDIVIDNLPEAEGSDNNFKNRIVKVYRTTRELDPLKNGIIEARYQLDAELHSITEYVEGFFSYPNTAIIGTRVNSKDHPDIPNKEYLIKGRMIRVPSNYDPVNGTYNGVWNGAFKQINNQDYLEWTSNPAWIIYDLLTHPSYGMGKYNIKDSDIDVWSFYRFAQFCDETVDTIIEGNQAQERRHMCNLYVDTEKQAYDYIKELLNIYNSSINFSGGQIYITCDFSEKDRNGSIMIFNNSNILENGFAYSSTPATSRITAVTVDYVDERDNYMQKSEYVEDQQSLKEHGYSHIRIAGIGITRRGEAHRLAWHKILSRQLEKEIINFKTGLRASYLRVGDVIEVMDKNKSKKHAGGKITKRINSNTVTIDIPAAALNNVDYLYIDTPAQSDDTEGSRTSQFTKYEIATKLGFEVSFVENLNDSIQAGSSWIIESNDADKVSPKKYRIKEIKEASNLEYEITALEYLESKYYYIDESTSSNNGIFIEERSSQAGNEITSFDIT